MKKLIIPILCCLLMCGVFVATNSSRPAAAQAEQTSIVAGTAISGDGEGYSFSLSNKLFQ